MYRLSGNTSSASFTGSAHPPVWSSNVRNFFLRPWWIGAVLVVSGACDGHIDEPTAPEPEVYRAPFAPQPGPMRRLAASEYRRTVQDLLGDAVVPPPVLEKDPRSGGDYGLIAVGVANVSLSARGVEAYETASYDLAEQALNSDYRDALVGCTPAATVDAACADAFIRHFGRRAWRRPLSTDERARLVALAGEAAERLGDFHRGLQFAVAAMLQSPYFVFRTEVGRPSQEYPGWHRLTDWELATRLAYFLWATTPDDELLDATAAGVLSTPEGLDGQVRRLLGDDRARQGMRAFFEDMLLLERLDEMSKDPTVFLHFSSEVGASAREETLRTLEHMVFDRDADYREIFTTRTTFIDRRLAAIYSVPAPAREGFGLHEHPEESLRRGLLGHVSFLAANAHVATTSPTLRGAYIRRTFMCASIPVPPPDVNTSIPEATIEAPTLRQRVARHLEEPVCAGCHLLMDPLGLGVEHFDALGRYRELENGAPIDASGRLSSTASFEDARSLGEALAEAPEVPRCLVQTLYRYGTGHIEVASEGEALYQYEQRFAESGYRVRDLLHAIATSEAFQLVAPPQQTAVIPEVRP